jgi:hypothetical protein
MWKTGVTRAGTIVKDLSRIACTANLGEDSLPVPGANWELVYPAMPEQSLVATNIAMAPLDTSYEVYAGLRRNWDSLEPVLVYLNTILVDPTVSELAEVATNPSVDLTTFVLSNANLSDITAVYVDTILVDPADYTANLATGQVVFGVAVGGGVEVTVDYEYVNYVVDYPNGTLTFREANIVTDVVKASFTWNSSALDESIGAITDRAIIKTTTTQQVIVVDPYDIDPDASLDQITMYLEIKRPDRLVNPETGLSNWVLVDGTLASTDKNWHYLNMRIFNEFDELTDLPTETAKVSEWAKLSWFHDFREVAKDEIDGDVGVMNIQEGIMLKQIRIIGIDEDVPVELYISSGNDRLIFTVTGDPSLDYNNFLCSFAYVGVMDSFEDGINDIAGNFVLTTGSSTIPVKLSSAPTEPASLDDLTSTNEGDGTLRELYGYSYVATWRNIEGAESVPSEHVFATISSDGQQPSYDTVGSITFGLTFPAEAVEFYIYRASTSGSGFNNAFRNKLNNYKLMYTSSDLSEATFTDNGSMDLGALVPSQYGRPKEGVVRDTISGAVKSVSFTEKFGKNTATGVSDLAVYKSRNGLSFQKHQVAYISPEEFMPKKFFSPSRWTNKFHMSPVYVVHGVEGYRGMLKDVAVVDTTSAMHLDELIVDRDLPSEASYKFFKVNSPYSILANSPNSLYGIAIKMV